MVTLIKLHTLLYFPYGDFEQVSHATLILLFIIIIMLL